MRERDRRLVASESGRTNQTRRGFLGVTGTGVLTVGGSLAGCLSLSEDDPPPLDIDEDELFAIAELERPSEPERLPLPVTEEFATLNRERAEALLAELPDNLETEIPNEAVREYITEYRDRAQSRLDDGEEATDEWSRLNSVRLARSDAAEAAGAYAVADSGRTRDEVHDAADPLRDSITAFETDLVRRGTDPAQAAVVYADLESRLESALRSLGRLDTQSPATSETKAVGEGAGYLEAASAQFDVVEYVDDQQDGEETFDETLRDAAESILDGVEERVADLPEGEMPAIGEAFFDAEVAQTPRESLARFLWHTETNYESARERLEDGQVARAVMNGYRIERYLLALDRLNERVADGAFDRPESAEDVRDHKVEAVEEVERVREEHDGVLFEQGLRHAIQQIHSGDTSIENAQEYSDIDHYISTAVFYPMANYGFATELARTLPEATQTVTDTLE